MLTGHRQTERHTMNGIKQTKISSQRNFVKCSFRRDRFLAAHPALPTDDLTKIALSTSVLARDAIVRTNRRAIALKFVRPSGTGVHCDLTVHFSVP